jgi:hypothetical protein
LGTHSEVIRKLVILALVGLGIFGLLAAITFVALEGNEVALLRIPRGDGTIVDVRVWIADEAGETWIEVASPEQPFYALLLANPDIEVVRRERTLRYRAVPDPSPAAHARIRRLLAEKYGLSDRWIGLLVDTSRSVAVRLAPRE